jgi:hypothetical protein
MSTFTAWYRDRKELLIQQMSDIKEEQLVCLWRYWLGIIPPERKWCQSNLMIPGGTCHNVAGKTITGPAKSRAMSVQGGLYKMSGWWRWTCAVEMISSSCYASNPLRYLAMILHLLPPPRKHGCRWLLLIPGGGGAIQDYLYSRDMILDHDQGGNYPLLGCKKLTSCQGRAVTAGLLTDGQRIVTAVRTLWVHSCLLTG